VLFRKSALIDSKIEDEYFDEMFFMYKEDVDICWRLRLLGWIFIYTPRAIAYHVRGTGVQDRTNILGIISARKKLNRTQKYYSFKNHQLMLFKNELIAPSKKGVIYIAIREIAILFWILIMEPYNLRVILELCKELPLALRKREVIMKRKRILANEIGQWLDRSVSTDI
jgi:GT2 family glycosyltransferase